MKGMIFTEFVDMVEQHFSPALLDEVLCSVELPSGGIYTAVGQYGHGELVTLVRELSARTGIPSNELVKAFGGFLFTRFTQMHPAFFVGPRDAFHLLSGIDDIIHPDVRKLYPDARPPRFEIGGDGVNTLVMTYRSDRHFGDLAEGLIRACIKHYDEDIALDREDISDAPGSVVRFTLARAGR